MKTLFANQDAEYLSSSCFAKYYLDQIEEEIENTLNQNGICDITVRFFTLKLSISIKLIEIIKKANTSFAA